ncbi:MAG: 16S rRNA (cytosine(1402)-N(4))-methyltransferase RsmH [Candidatus Dojkabacteria bacterium]|jgi:16S rRNA (cytosine1402-N4)-methyltransferase
MNKIHIPVLLSQTIDSLNIKPNGFYIDCTLGDGGHSFEVIQKLSDTGTLLSIDCDLNAIEFVEEYYKDYLLKRKNWIIKKGNFRNIRELVKEINRKPNGILIDLGISSRQIEESKERGFSYMQEEEPLDMRMDSELNVTAKDLLNALSVKELTFIFNKYGEERYSNLIAKHIKENISNINTVGDLTRLIYKVMPAVNSNKNPSRRVFQALRIVVNDELNSLKIALDESFEILKENGRISVISFHSLEDRIVKNYFLEKQGSGEGEILFKSHIAPTDDEKKQNPRSASAKLRTIIKKQQLDERK